MTDNPVVGTIDVTARDLAFINRLFGLTTELGKHPYILNGQFKMMTDLAFIITLGKNCDSLINSLHDVHEQNITKCIDVQRNVAPEVATIVLAMLCAASETADSPSAKSAFDKQVAELFSKDYEPEGFKNAPETGYI